MRIKIGFMLVFLIILLLSEKGFTEERIQLISYYPSPYGAYNQLMIGQGVQQPESSNNETLMRIGVIDDTYDSSQFNYTPAALEIGGIAKVPHGVDKIPTPPSGLGLYVEGDTGIVAVTYSDSYPAITGYIPRKGDGSLRNGPVIFAAGANVGLEASGEDTGVMGKGNRIGVLGSVSEGQHPDAYGVYGEANNPDSCGVIGVNGENLSLEERGDKSIGVFGKSANGYAGYFSGNLKVTKRAELSIPNIPVFENDTTRDEVIPHPQEGDLICNKNENGGEGALQIYVDGGWKTL